MADCKRTLEELEQYLDGELADNESAHVLAHLDECIECYHAFDFQAELKQIIAAKCASEALPPGLLERIQQRLAAEEA
jgi:mycothiol system anti-sigma-R factor